nr:uncharacterized protein LOC128688067 [Cherax quadricarinatus]
MNAIIDPDINLLFNCTHNPNSNCHYYTASQANTLLSVSKNITVFNYNVRSLSKHYDDLIGLLKSLNATITFIILTETWFIQELTDIFTIPGYTAIHNCRPDQSGGGTAIYYSDELECMKSTNVQDENGKYIIAAFKSRTLKKPITVGTVYRLPHTNTYTFSSNLRNMIIESELNKHHLILTGDFIINLIQATDPPVADFTNTVNNSLLLSSIMKPTRISETSASLFDHIWTNTISPLQAGIITDNTTDHYPTFLITNLSKLPQETRKISFRLHDETSINIKLALGANWQRELADSTIDKDVKNFLHKTLNLYNKHCPIKMKRITEKR